MGKQLARDLQILIDQFKLGGWKELRIDSDTISLLLSTDGAAVSLDGGVPVAAPPPLTRTTPLTHTAPGASPAIVAASASSGPIDPAWTVVVAPNLGTFYRSPKPGSAPFVEVGQKVAAQTEVCLIEVMKLFTSVQAGVSGTVRHVAVADAQLVEGGQALLYIESE